MWLALLDSTVERTPEVCSRSIRNEASVRPSGRSSQSRCALTLRTSPSSQSIWSTTWLPMSRSRPPPGPASSVAGSSRSKRECTRHSSPSRPLSTTEARVRMSASQRRLWNTDSSTPAESAAAASSRPTSAVGANGLSATTCTPAATASRTSSRRVSGGVVMVTASTPLASSAPRLSKTGTPGQSSATSARRWGERVTTPASSMPSAASMNGVWKKRPPAPYPTTPSFTAIAAAPPCSRRTTRVR